MKLIIMTSRHDKVLNGRRSCERKTQWDIRDGSELSRVTKSERERRCFRKSAELMARCPETVKGIKGIL